MMKRKDGGDGGEDGEERERGSRLAFRSGRQDREGKYPHSTDTKKIEKRLERDGWMCASVRVVCMRVVDVWRVMDDG